MIVLFYKITWSSQCTAEDTKLNTEFWYETNFFQIKWSRHEKQISSYLRITVWVVSPSTLKALSLLLNCVFSVFLLTARCFLVLFFSIQLLQQWSFACILKLWCDFAPICYCCWCLMLSSKQCFRCWLFLTIWLG